MDRKRIWDDGRSHQSPPDGFIKRPRFEASSGTSIKGSNEYFEAQRQSRERQGSIETSWDNAMTSRELLDARNGSYNLQPPNIAQVEITQSEAELIQQSLPGDDESDMNLLFAQRNLMVSKVRAQLDVMNQMQDCVSTLHRYSVELEAAAERGVRNLACVQEDLGLCLAYAGSEAQVVSAHDEASVITAVILLGGEQGMSGIHALYAILESATRSVTSLVDIISREKANSTQAKSDDPITITHAKAMENQSMLKQRIRVHDEEIATLEKAAITMKERIAELRAILDDVKFELFKRRSQITRKNVLLHELSSVNGIQGKEENASGQAHPKMEPTDQIRTAVDAVANLEESGQDSRLQQEKKAASGTIQALKAEESMLIHQNSNYSKDSRADMEKQVSASAKSLEVDFKQSNQRWNLLVTKSALYRKFESKLSAVLLDLGKLRSMTPSFAERSNQVMENLRSCATGKALMTDHISALKDKEESAESLTKKLQDYSRMAERYKGIRDQLTLKYEYMKISEGNREAASCFEKLRSLDKAVQDTLNEELERLQHGIAIYEKQAESSSVKAATLRDALAEEKEREDGYIDAIERMTGMVSDLEQAFSKCKSIIAEYENSTLRAASEVTKNKQQLQAIERDSEAENAELQQQVISAHRLETMVERAKESVVASQNARLESLQHVFELRHKLTESVLEIKTHLSRIGLLGAQITEARILREKTTAKVSHARNSLTEIFSKVQAAQEAMEDLKLNLAKERAIHSKSGNLSAADLQEQGVMTPEQREQAIADLRKKLNCSVLPTLKKDVVITRCGHLLSRKCAEDLIANRNRKCPVCGERFGQDDVKAVHFE